MADGTTTTTTATTTATDGAAAAVAAAAAATAATPWYQGKADAETIGHWDNKGWKKDDPAAIAIEATKAARELQKHFGVPADQLIKLPSKPDDEGWAGVHQRLGVPKEAKEYEFSVKHADGRDVDAALSDSLRAAMLAARTPKDHASEIVKAVVKNMDDRAAAEKSERDARVGTQRAELQKNWGQNFEFNRLTAMQGAKRLGLTPESVTMLEGQIGYTNLMEAMRKIGAGTTEDTFVESGQGGSPTTQNGARARLAELQNDKEWVARFLKGNAAEKREHADLMQIIAGEAA